MNKKIVFETPFFAIEELPATDKINDLPYYRLNGPDSVICCVINEMGDFIMVKQFRPNFDAHTLEFPAGEIDFGETPSQAAAREIREELGLECKMISLGSYLLMMNRTNINNYLYFCLARDSVLPFPTEQGIESIKISREDFKELLKERQYFQLAGLGILQLASLRLNVDVLNDSVETVLRAFKAHTELV